MPILGNQTVVSETLRMNALSIHGLIATATEDGYLKKGYALIRNPALTDRFKMAVYRYADLTKIAESSEITGLSGLQVQEFAFHDEAIVYGTQYTLAIHGSGGSIPHEILEGQRNVLLSESTPYTGTLPDVLTAGSLEWVITIYVEYETTTEPPVEPPTGEGVNAVSNNPADLQDAADRAIQLGVFRVLMPPSIGYWNGETVRTSAAVDFICPVGRAVLQEQQPAIDGLGAMIKEECHGGAPEFSGIDFKGLVVGTDVGVDRTAINFEGAKDFIIHHCTFDNFPDAAVGGYDNRGLIHHCDVDNTYKIEYGGVWAYGFSFLAHNLSSWNSDIYAYLGKYASLPFVVYVEDCTFKRCRHAVAANQAQWIVVRHCTFDFPVPMNFAPVDVHPYGRGIELYDCVIRGMGVGSQAIWIRGGGGVMFNNTIIDNSVGVQVRSEVPDNIPKDFWVGSNEYINVSTPVQILEQQGALTEGVNYHYGMPPNYAPLKYPHYLATGEAPPEEPPIEPPAQPCAIRSATEGTVFAGILPVLRLFRDNSLPRMATRDYYALSRYVAPKIDAIRKKVGEKRKW